MALGFDGGYLDGSQIYQSMPLTVGMWAKFGPAADILGTFPGSPVLWSETINTSIANFLILSGSSDGPCFFGVSDDALNSIRDPIGSDWCFIVARIISLTSRRLDLLYSDGEIESITGDGNSINVATMGLNRHSIGAFVVDGIGVVGLNTNNSTIIAEWWSLDSNVQPEDDVIDPALMYKLAYSGPFSLRHLVPHIRDYLRLWHAPIAAQGEGFVSRTGMVWNQIGVTGTGIGRETHPPLPYWYCQPGKIITQPLALV